MIKRIKNYRNKGKSLLYHFRLTSRGLIKKLTIKRIVNILYVLSDWKFKRSKVGSRPFIIRLEPSAVCNLKCPSCTTPKRKFGKDDIKIMDMDSYQNIFDKISDHSYRMTFYIKGEPMTNPDLFKMIAIASDKKIYSTFCTNFTLMDKDKLNELFESKLDWISICLDGFSQEAFEKYRVNGQVSKVKDGISMLMEHKINNNYKYPFVNIYSITFNHVKPEMELIKEFCDNNHVDQLKFRPDESNWDGSHQNVTIKKDFAKCFWPWMCLSVDVDGSVYPCNPAMDIGYKYGNIKKQSLNEIWNNELFVETRKYLSGKSEKIDRLDLPCYKCRNYGCGD